MKMEVYTVLRNELTLKVEECLTVLELSKVRDFSEKEIHQHEIKVKDQQMAKVLSQMEEFKTMMRQFKEEKEKQMKEMK